MRRVFVKSSVVATAVGVGLLVAALTASSLSVPGAPAEKSDRLYPLQPSACPAWNCDDQEMTYSTTVETDAENGVTTLIRSAVPVK